MVREVEIRDKKTGQILRETYTQNTHTFFGPLNISASDIIKIAGLIIMIIIFFINGQNDKKIMQQSLDELKATTSRLIDFKENSDGWDSQVFGTRFRNGEPIDTNFKVHNQGKLGG